MCNILNNSFGAPWTYNFYSTGIFNILVGVAIIMFLKDKPENKEESKI
jgi:sugar phosphate permease